jgi:hypothetical protein
MVVESGHLRNSNGCRIASEVGGGQEAEKLRLKVSEDRTSFHRRELANDALGKLCECLMSRAKDRDKTLWVGAHARKALSA